MQVSGLYGRAVAPERPVWCRCGLAFDTADARDAHVARPMRHGPGPRMPGRPIPHGPPTVRYTRTERGLAGPLVRDGESHGLTDVRPLAHDAAGRLIVRVKLARWPRAVRVRGPRAGPLPPNGGRKGRPVPQNPPAPRMPEPDLPRAWTLAPAADPGCTRVQRTTQGIAHGVALALVFESESAPPEPGPDVIAQAARRKAARPLTRRDRAVLKVRTADPARVATLRRAWNRRGRWVDIRSRPDPELGTVYVVLGGVVHQGPKRPSGAKVSTTEPIVASVTYYRLESR